MDVGLVEYELVYICCVIFLIIIYRTYNYQTREVFYHITIIIIPIMKM